MQKILNTGQSTSLSQYEIILINYWASDKNFKNLSVANIANRASTQGSSIHTDGSISMDEKERRMVRHVIFSH